MLSVKKLINFKNREERGIYFFKIRKKPRKIIQTMLIYINSSNINYKKIKPQIPKFK